MPSRIAPGPGSIVLLIACIGWCRITSFPAARAARAASLEYCNPGKTAIVHGNGRRRKGSSWARLCPASSKTKIRVPRDFPGRGRSGGDDGTVGIGERAGGGVGFAGRVGATEGVETTDGVVCVGAGPGRAAGRAAGRVAGAGSGATATGASTVTGRVTGSVGGLSEKRVNKTASEAPIITARTTRLVFSSPDDSR